MSRIRILPDEVANRIAAGEVIERPASVVKELIENAVDAGAARIAVRVRQGGRRLIQVADDGCGMDREDALLCIEAHATSKIRGPEDIERIATLGFRGEALPSIASVSRFRLQTRPHDAEAGTEIRVEAGNLRDVRDCGCAPGTTVWVESLFYNLPARRKFLRSAATESAHIQETVLLQALAHTRVGFELTMDGRRTLAASARDDLAARVFRLLGRDAADAMLPVEYEEEGIRVSGFAARPGFTRSSRREQRFFVNGRPAEVDTAYFGLRDAYHTLVMKGRYPPAVLFLELDPKRVDVNVHPAKREVRFRDPRAVGRVIAAAVRRALREAAISGGAGPEQPEWPRPRPTADLPTPAAPGLWEERAPAPEPGPADSAPPADSAGSSPPRPVPEAPAGVPEPAADIPKPIGPPHGGIHGPSPSAAVRPEIARLRILGAFQNLYLVAESESGLVLIDQHAMHERILFERLLAAARAGPDMQQPLLLPVTVHLAPADSAFLLRHIEQFQKIGFAVEPFGGDTVLITAVPPGLPQENLAGLLRDMLDELRESPSAVARPDEVRIAQAACKHAVRARDPLEPEEIRELLRALARTEMPYTCPHGRPVMIKITLEELEKRFGRRT